MKIESKKIKGDIKKLSKNFGLKYNSKWFNFILVSKREQVLNDFITGCPDPRYNKYGISHNTRIKNLGIFLKSKEYKELLRPHGCVKLKKYLKGEIKLSKSIEDKKIRREYLNILKKTKNKFKGDALAMITIPKTKKELKYVLYILSHEWVHILLIKNKIYTGFYKLNDRKYRVLDEGLTVYLDYLINEGIDKLKERAKKLNSETLTSALKWKGLLETKNIPDEKRKAIINYYKNLI